MNYFNIGLKFIEAFIGILLVFFTVKNKDALDRVIGLEKYHSILPCDEDKMILRRLYLYGGIGFVVLMIDEVL